MLRRVVFFLNENKTLVVRAARRMSSKPQSDPQPKDKETTNQTPKQETPEEEDPNAYEDYGDVKIRKGGRTIKVDESEDQGGATIKKGFNVVSTGFRVIWWGSLAYLAYTFYDYKSNADKKAANAVDEYFLEAAKYIDNTYRKGIDLFTKPPTEKLLPEIPVELYPPGFEFPKTLLINLSGTTIHSNFKLGKGRELIKRPGLDELISHFSQRCEIVIFSDDDHFLIHSLIPKLDPTGQRLSFALGSESMCLEGSKRIKDLKYINRDPRKIIVLDNIPQRLKNQENGIFIPTFEGNPDDDALFKLFPLLEYLTHPSVSDVRDELKKYGHDNPGEKFLQEIEKRKAAMSQKRKGGFASMFGGSGPRPQQQQQRAPSS